MNTFMRNHYNVFDMEKGFVLLSEIIQEIEEC